MRAPPLSFIVVLAIIAATVPTVPAQYENLEKKPESKGEEAAAAGYGPPKKATEKPMEQTVDARVTPAMTPNAYNDKAATASGTEVKNEKPDVSVEPALPRKVKKVEKAKKETPVESGKKENKEPVYLDGYYLDKGTSSKNEKKEKPVDSVKHASAKKEKKEKSIESGGSSAYVKKEEKKSGVDEAVSPKKEEKEKIKEEKSLKKEKKEKKEEEKAGDYSVKKENKEKPVKDATPVAASTDGGYIPK